jgi:hypothetical protein
MPSLTIRTVVALAVAAAALALPARLTAGDPLPDKAAPAFASRGAHLIVKVTGDNMGDVTKGDFGPDIEVGTPTVLGSGEVWFPVKISDKADKTVRDVTVTDKLGKTGTIKKGFEVK